MKKRLLFISAFFALATLFTQAQDTIVAWTFPTGGLADSIANIGTVGNVGVRTLMHEGGTGAATMVPGDGTYAEEVSGWNNGDTTKFWSIKFKAEGYHDIVLYSKQMSDANLYGPRDWKVQYKWGATPWTDIPGGTVVCSSAWTMGVANALAIPVSIPGGTSIFVRWIMTSNIALDLNPVLPTGKSAIDDIIIMGNPDQPVVVSGDTIIGFNFADSTDHDFNADFGLVGNLTYDIRAEDTSGASRPLTYTNGLTDFAAAAAGWDDGDAVKYWSIKFKANGFKDLKVWSKQRSGGNTPGPKYWKLQGRMSGGVWADITGGNVVVANDWATGVISELALPASFDDPGTTSIFLRWVMTSNESTGSGDVISTGISKIDDIVVTGTLSGTGISSVIYENNVSIYPNPCKNILNIESAEGIAKTEIYNILGAKVYASEKEAQNLQINVNNFDSGLYIVILHFANESKIISRKVIID